MSSTDKYKPAKISRPPWQRSRAKHLSDLVGNMLNDIIVRRSGMNLDLLAAWPEIIGPNYANHTRPEKINWPRRMSEDEPFQPGNLTIACDSSKAIFLQHEGDQIIERINSFFGFIAVKQIKIVQKPMHHSDSANKQIRPLVETEEKRLTSILSKIEDPALRKSLEKFGRGVIAKSNKKGSSAAKNQ